MWQTFKNGQKRYVTGGKVCVTQRYLKVLCPDMKKVWKPNGPAVSTPLWTHVWSWCCHNILWRWQSRDKSHHTVHILWASWSSVDQILAANLGCYLMTISKCFFEDFLLETLNSSLMNTYGRTRQSFSFKELFYRYPPMMGVGGRAIFVWFGDTLGWDNPLVFDLAPWLVSEHDSFK